MNKKELKLLILKEVFFPYEGRLNLMKKYGVSI